MKTTLRLTCSHKFIAEELHLKKPVIHIDSDSDVETNHPLDDVARVVEQFKHENKGNVNKPMITTDDYWLNKVVGNGTFIRQTENPSPNLQCRFLLEVEILDDEQVESKFKAKKNVSYPSFNPDTPWNECKPVLEMRDVSEGKYVGLKGKPKIVDNEECESSKQGSKNGDGRKAVNEIPFFLRWWYKRC
nr:hypothetical protein [Tanacetum cinerariifolium]